MKDEYELCKKILSENQLREYERQVSEVSQNILFKGLQGLQIKDLIIFGFDIFKT